MPNTTYHCRSKKGRKTPRPKRKRKKRYGCDVCVYDSDQVPLSEASGSRAFNRPKTNAFKKEKLCSVQDLSDLSECMSHPSGLIEQSFAEMSKIPEDEQQAPDDFAISVAHLHVYARHKNDRKLNGLVSKLCEGLITEKSRKEDMGHSLQMLKTENQSLHRTLKILASEQACQQEETIQIKKDRERELIKTGIKVKYLIDERENLELTLGEEINKLQEKLVQKNVKLRSVENALQNVKQEVNDKTNLLQKLKKKEKCISEITAKLINRSKTLEDTRTELQIVKSEREKEVLKRNEFEKQATDYAKRIKQLEETIDKYETETSHKERTINKLNDVLEQFRHQNYDREQSEMRLKVTEEQIVKKEHEQEQTLAELRKVKAELNLMKFKTESDVLHMQNLERDNEKYENIIRHLEDHHHLEKTPLRQRISELENEIKDNVRKRKSLENKVNNMTSEISESKTARKTFEEMKEELFETKEKLKEKSIALKKTRELQESTLRKRLETDKQTDVYRHRITRLEEAHMTEVASIKDKIYRQEQEMKLKSSKIKDLEKMLDQHKQKLDKRVQIEAALKATVSQMTVKDNEQQQMRARLRDADAKLRATESDIVSYKHSVQRLEKEASEYENRIKFLKCETEEKITSLRLRINTLENEIDEKNLEIESLKNKIDFQTENSNSYILGKKLKDTEELLLKTNEAMKETQKELHEIRMEKEQELGIQASEHKNRISQLENRNKQVVTSLEERIIQKELEMKEKDSRIETLEALHEQYKQNITEKDRTEANFKLAASKISQMENETKTMRQKLRESEAKLTEMKSETESCQLLKQKLMKEEAKHESRIKTLIYEKDDISRTLQLRISELENQIVVKDQEKEATRMKMRDSNMLNGKLEEIEKQFLKTRQQLQEASQLLEEKEQEMQAYKKERIRETTEYKNYIKQVEETNKSDWTSLQATLQRLEKEAEGKGQIIEHLKQQIGDLNSREKYLKLTEEKCRKTEGEYQQTLAKLREMEAKYNGAKSEIVSEKNKRQELEIKVSEYESNNKHSNEENEKILTSLKQNTKLLKKEIRDKDQKVKILEDYVDSLKTDAYDRDKIIQELKETKIQLAELDSQHRQTLANLREMEAKHNGAKSEIVSEKNKRQELEIKVSEYESNIKHSSEENEKILNSLNQTIRFLKKEIKDKDQKVKALEDLVDSLKTDAYDRDKIRQELKETKIQLAKLDNQHRMTLATLRMKETELNETKQNGKSQSFGSTTTDLGDKLRQALTKLQQTEAELEETKTRLSKAMGDKLTDNNPNIADLSDKNRPVKLAERFNELYDNQWTDAFDILENQYDSEQYTIEALLGILQDVMIFCEDTADQQLQDLQNSLQLSSSREGGEFPADVRKYLKDCRKKMASAVAKNLHGLYLAHLKRAAPEKLNTVQNANSYVKECLEICWLMVIQDPPVVFAPVAKHDSVLNTDMFKPYTSSGTHVKFTVWPALLLHKGGPILAKGVAQGYGKKSGSKRSS